MEEWFASKDFTRDYTTGKLELWQSVLAPMRDSPADVLEVGTFEGRSAVAFLEMLPRSTITCIDWFSHEGSEARFDRNLASYGERVTKKKGRAAPIMDDLMAEERLFDMIYLDCAKDRVGAFVLSAMAFALLKVDGVMIWDDLAWGKDRPDHKRPEPGSRFFIQAFKQCIIEDETAALLAKTHERRGAWRGQFIGRKVKDWPFVRLPHG